jgi:hypothetical protein
MGFGAMCGWLWTSNTDSVDLADLYSSVIQHDEIRAGAGRQNLTTVRTEDISSETRDGMKFKR